MAAAKCTMSDKWRHHGAQQYRASTKLFNYEPKSTHLLIYIIYIDCKTVRF